VILQRPVLLVPFGGLTCLDNDCWMDHGGSVGMLVIDSMDDTLLLLMLNQLIVHIITSLPPPPGHK